MHLGLSILVLVAVFAGCRGHSLKMGGCPRVTVMKHFDFEKFLGDWYVVQRFNPISTCTKISIEKDKEGKYTVSESSWPFGINFRRNRSENHPRRSRKLTFPRDDAKSIFKVQTHWGRFSLRTFGVVDTDYTNYAVVWGCDALFMGSIQNGDILSRHPDIGPDLILQGRKTLEEMGIDIQPMRNVDQSRCSGKKEEGTNTETDYYDSGSNLVPDAQYVSAPPHWERLEQGGP